MSSLDIEIRLNGPQFEAFQAVKPGATILTGFGRGVGKSWFLRFLWFTFIAQMDGKIREIMAEGMTHRRKGVAIGVMTPSLKQFKDIHADGIQEELASDGQWGFLGGHYERQSGKITFPGGSTITPFPAAEHTSKKARGPRVDIASCDEVDDIDADVHDGILIPWMSAPWSLGIEISGGTPTRGRHGLWWRMMEDGRLGAKLRDGATPAELNIDAERAEALRSCYSFHAWYKHAPETVSPAAVAKAKATTPKATFEREWEANPDAGEGLVYVFDDEFHVRTAPPWSEFNEFLVGADHGDVDPAVLILFGIKGHGNDAQVWALDEWYESEQLNSVWDERLAAWDFATVYADPSRKDRLRDWRSQGRKVRDLPAEVKPIAAGIARVADLLHRRTNEQFGDWCRFYVDPKCRNLIREFGLYRRKKHPDGTFSETPEDKNNHCLVGETLITTERGDIPISDVVIGDMAMTRSGWRPVTNSWLSRKDAELMTLTTSNGESVTGTPSHKIWTENRGWVRMHSLRYGDMVRVCPSKTYTENQSPSSMPASAGADTQIPRSEVSGCTGGTRSRVVSRLFTCTAKSIVSTLGKFLQSITSTTLTTIHSTTIRRTLSVSQNSITSLNTDATQVRSIASGALGTWMRFVRSPNGGTRAKLDLLGTENTGKTCLPTEQSQNSPVSIAQSRFCLCRSEHTDFAPTLASQHGAGELDSTMSPGHVRGAQRNSSSTSTAGNPAALASVVGVRREARTADVYDLTIEGEHEFFAGGILVHNSMDATRYALAGRFGRVPSYRQTLSGS